MNMRIAFLTHYAELYGANRSLLDLAEGLRTYGVSSHVISPQKGDLLAELKNRKVKSAVLPFEWWMSTRRTAKECAERAKQNARGLKAIVEQLKKWKVDLVYSNSSVIGVGRDAAAKLKLPHVWHVREFGAKDYDLVPDVGVRDFRRALVGADATIFVSQSLRREFFGEQARPNVHVIYNGVATAAKFDERRRAAEALYARRQPFTFVLVGRFRESKGQAVAIRAFEKIAGQFPEIRLILVGDAGRTGDPEYFDACRSLAAASPAKDRIEFWGYVADPERAFLAADAALMCSRNEAMGRVTVEAMSACRPVIGYDSGGTSELIESGRTGMTYHGDFNELAAMMAHYVNASDVARRHGEEAWSIARDRHSIETYAAQVYDVLVNVASPTKPPRP